MFKLYINVQKILDFDFMAPKVETGEKFMIIFSDL